MPVPLGPHRGVIRALIVQGSAPLLTSRSALKKLGAQLDFQKDTLSILGSPSIQLRTNSAGQYIVDVMGSPLGVGDTVADEIMMATADISPALDSGAQASNACRPASSKESTGPEASDASVRLSSWAQGDCQRVQAPWLSRYGSQAVSG